MNSAKQLVFIMWASENAIRRLSMVTHRKLLDTEKLIADRISKDQTEQGEGMFILMDAWYTSAATLVYFTL